MKLAIRGWQRVQGQQTVFNKPVAALESRSDDAVIATGTKRAVSGGVNISFRGRATCSPNSNYMFTIELSEADLDALIDMVRARDEENVFGIQYPT